MIKIAIIEDHKSFRESISYIFSSTEGFKCDGAFTSVEEALEKIKNPDVILLDINLPGMSGLDGIFHLKKKSPPSKIIMLTIFEDDQSVFHAILNGADGYILKKTAPLRLMQAVEDAALGGSPMSPTIAKKTLQLFKQYVPVKGDDHSLSEREIEVLALLVDGLNNDEISNKLFISIQTVRNHIRHIYEKLHVHSKSQAVVKALKEGII